MTPLVSLGIALVVVAVIAWLVNYRIALGSSVRTIVNIVLALIVVGAALWLINTYVPMAGSIKAILNIVVVIATCVRVLQAVGLWGETTKLWNNLTHFRTSRISSGS